MKSIYYKFRSIYVLDIRNLVWWVMKFLPYKTPSKHCEAGTMMMTLTLVEHRHIVLTIAAVGLELNLFET